MGFSDLLKGGLLGSVGSVIGSGINAISANSNTKKMIQAQKEMNDRNIQAQKDINDQNIAFQQNVNDIMRHDTNNAISIKKRDLINAGYSTANPDLQGMPAASLGSPSLTAPQVQSEYTPEMAAQQLQAGSSFSDSLLNSASAMADIALKRAQAKESGTRATGNEIENAWKDTMLGAEYDVLVQTLDNMKKEGVLTEAKTNESLNHASVLHQQCKLLTQDIKMAELNVKFRPYEFAVSFQQAISTINEIAAKIVNTQAQTENTKADTNNKYLQGNILRLEGQLKQIEVNFAKFGINFNSSSLLDTIGRIALAPNSSKTATAMLKFVSNSFTSMMDMINGSKGKGNNVFTNPNLYPQGIPSLYNKSIFHGFGQPWLYGTWSPTYYD